MTNANILKHAGQDYSNHGISERFDTVKIVDESALEAPENAVVLKYHMGEIIAEPFHTPDGAVGPMMGGTFLAVPATFTVGGLSVHFGQAIRLHDRFETPAQYAALNR
jgi:hypothetical protein